MSSDLTLNGPYASWCVKFGLVYSPMGLNNVNARAVVTSANNYCLTNQCCLLLQKWSLALLVPTLRNRNMMGSSTIPPKDCSTTPPFTKHSEHQTQRSWYQAQHRDFSYSEVSTGKQLYVRLGLRIQGTSSHDKGIVASLVTLGINWWLWCWWWK